MHRNVRPIVIIVFFAWLCFSVAVIPDIRVGLDQELAVMKDSYLHKYFRVSDELHNPRNRIFLALTFYFRT